MAYVSATDAATFGDPAINALVQALANAGVSIGVDQVATFVSAVNGSLLIKDVGGTVRKAAFRNPGRRVSSVIGGTDIVLQSDEGQIIDFIVDDANGTLNLDVLEINTQIDLRNASNVFMNLVENGTTLNWISATGLGPPTGDRVIAANSIVHLRWLATNIVEVWGNGIN